MNETASLAPRQDDPDLPLQRRAVVHIGLNKTGSTTIQGWLLENRLALREQGIYFDRLGHSKGPNLSMAVGFAMYALSLNPDWMPKPFHRRLYRLTDRVVLDRKVADFLERAERSFPPRDHGTYVVSSEYLGGWLKSRRAIHSLHNWLKPRFASVDYIVYIRDQVDWLPSHYQQSVKNGIVTSLDDFVGHRGKNDYNATVEKWGAVVGEAHFNVRLLERDFLVNGDIVDDFAHMIEADASKMVRPLRKNKSMSALRLRATLWANRSVGRLFTKLGWVERQRALHKRLMIFEKGNKLRLNPKQAARVRAQNAESNERLRARLFPNRPVLFSSSAATQDFMSKPVREHFERNV